MFVFMLWIVGYIYVCFLFLILYIMIGFSLPEGSWMLQNLYDCGWPLWMHDELIASVAGSPW